MNRSTLLLLFCVFALSETLLAVEMARLRIDRGAAETKDSDDVRVVNSANCVTLEKCNEMCKYLAGTGGILQRDYSPTGNRYCRCFGIAQPLPEIDCVKSCEDLGVRGGEKHFGLCYCDDYCSE
ncbi:hypothetical protein DdX_17431 [Ditylenchus destructor]|uniref:Uncharacterized protein n=1 Tax=Ditylenchus destructor TaxID=166010 RepID=A0AAD4MP25_9BILA|nr:hypothetical protein DdX_17431 [Ditylenchus destructor]